MARRNQKTRKKASNKKKGITTSTQIQPAQSNKQQPERRVSELIKIWLQNILVFIVILVILAAIGLFVWGVFVGFPSPLPPLSYTYNGIPVQIYTNELRTGGLHSHIIFSQNQSSICVTKITRTLYYSQVNTTPAQANAILASYNTAELANLTLCNR
ncbi:MAG: hypothetical protein QXS81_01285 [Candidatus Micrarchaeaceae archaeon]